MDAYIVMTDSGPRRLCWTQARAQKEVDLGREMWNEAWQVIPVEVDSLTVPVMDHFAFRGY